MGTDQPGRSIAVAYCRISQDRTGEELGVTRQRAACEELARRRGWELAHVYVDNDVSAAAGKHRPQWEAMMAEVEAGRVDVVIGWTVDRTLRSGRDRLRMLEVGKAQSLLISLVRGSDMDLSTPSGRLAADILGAVALAEIETKADRQRAANRQAAERGKRFGGRRAFGFEIDGVTVRPAEAEAIRAAYAGYLHGDAKYPTGVPIIEIARRWNGAGLFSGVVDPTTGEPTKWDHSGVRAVLRNPRYYGGRRYQPHGAKAAEVYAAAWPALVDETLWRRVNARLDSSAADKPRGRPRRVLTGLAECAVCGLPMHSGGNKKGAAPMYRCPTGSHVARRAEPIEEQVGRLIVARLSEPDALARLAEADRDDQATDLVRQAEELREELDTLALERIQKKITPRQFGLMNAGVLEQLEDVERRMASSGDAAVRRLAVGLTWERWEALEDTQRRALVAWLISEITVASGGRGVRNPSPDTIKIKWVDET